MKLSKLLFLLIIINLLYVIVGFVIDNSDIHTLETRLTDTFDSQFTLFDKFLINARNSDNYLFKFASEALAGVTNTLNLMFIGVKIIGLVGSLYISPIIGSYQSNAESITILRIIGLIGALYLWWFNIRTAIKVYLVIKGSDS